MKAPYPAGTPIDLKRFRKWLYNFTSYCNQITEDGIRLWINQFLETHRDLAARLLDSVDFIGHEQISTAFRELLSGIDGWSPKENKRRGKWYFVAYSDSAGESGDEMLHKFRTANHLNYKKYNSLFVYKSELMSLDLGPEDTVLFIDDFSGSGDQVCKSWLSIQELLPGEPRIFLILVAASKIAINRIKEETDMGCISHKMLREKDCVFSKECHHFNVSEKNTILEYCSKVDSENPMGYGDCGFLIVFSHSCPNNTIPILHKSTREWDGLFR